MASIGANPKERKMEYTRLRVVYGAVKAALHYTTKSSHCRLSQVEAPTMAG
jgi:hypothetical protein